MTSHEPPRLPLALLERLVPDSSVLAGDLVEEYRHRRSPWWLWWQVLGAIAIAGFTRPDPIRPLRLVPQPPDEVLERAHRMALHFEPINVTGSPLKGIGGLGIASLALLTTAVKPAAWWLFLASIPAGLVLGVVMIAARRRQA
jgi:hypothetical protein